MTMYESGSIALSQLQAVIDDENSLSKDIIQIYILSMLTQHFLTLTIAC